VRPSQSKPKQTAGRAKAAAPAAAATTKRGAGALTTATRRRPSKVAEVRRRPRR
jgi:hypothetical protein